MNFIIRILPVLRSLSKATKDGENLKGFTNSTVNYKSESQDFRNINISLFVV